MRDLVKRLPFPASYPQQDAWVRTPGVEPPTITVRLLTRYDWTLKDIELDPGPEIEREVKRKADELQRRIAQQFLARLDGTART